MGLISDCYEHLNTTNWHRIAAALFVAAMGIGFGIGFSVSMDDAKAIADADEAARQSLFIEWQMILTSQFARADSVATALASFVFSHAITPTNYSAPVADRVIEINNASFYRLCGELVALVPGIISLQLHTGGVSSQVYPTGFTRTGTEMVTSASRGVAYPDIINGGKAVTIGPYAFIQGGIGTVIRYPVYTSEEKRWETFWGMANVFLRFTDLFESLMVDSAIAARGMDYVCFYVNRTGIPTVVSSSKGADVGAVIANGLRMTIPVAEEGTVTYFSIDKHGGVASASLSGATAAAVVVGVVLASLAIAALLYCALLAAFAFRHRHAPTGTARSGRNVFIAAFSLRGAQSVIDHDAEEGARMAEEFYTAVRSVAARTKGSGSVYIVGPVGDRTLLAASDDAQQLMLVAQEVAGGVAVAPRLVRIGSDGGKGTTHGGDTTTRIGGESAANGRGQRRLGKSGRDGRSGRARSSRAGTAVASSLNSSVSSASNVATSRAGVHFGVGSVPSHVARTATATVADDAPSRSSAALVSSALCRPSVALHALPVALRVGCAYDATRDAYFFGTAGQLGRLGAVTDSIAAGEVAWTAAFSDASPVRPPHNGTTMDERGKVSTFVATWWHPSGDGESDRSGEDPSLAVAMMADAHLKRMGAIVSELEAASDGRGGARHRHTTSAAASRGAGGKAGKSGAGKEAGKSVAGSEGSAGSAAVLTRMATILHIQISSSNSSDAASFIANAKAFVETARRIAAEERGAIVSAHDATIVVAFNLLSAGGHHQLRAAEAVLRLRAAFPSSGPLRFVCSIHHGKVTALVAEGLAMCTGEAVAYGRLLIDRAAAMVRLAPRSAADGSPQTLCSLGDAEGTSGGTRRNNFTAASGSAGAGAGAALSDADPSNAVRPFGAFGTSLNNAPAETTATATVSTVVVTADSDAASLEAASHGLCLLTCYAELSTACECEAIDVVLAAPSHSHSQPEPTTASTPPPTTSSPPLRVLFRLAGPKGAYAGGGKHGGGDEWMYQLRDGEEASAFAGTNAVFGRIAADDAAGAAQLFEKCRKEASSSSACSPFALGALRRLLPSTVKV